MTLTLCDAVPSSPVYLKNTANGTYVNTLCYQRIQARLTADKEDQEEMNCLKYSHDNVTLNKEENSYTYIYVHV